MAEQDRIDLLNIIRDDNTKVSVAKVTEVFCGIMAVMDKNSKTLKRIKNKISEDEYIQLMTSICNSFLSTLYINAAEDEKDWNDRLEVVEKANKDLISYKEVLEESGVA